MSGPDHLFLRACRREPTPRVPIWMMRQAGRYMADYMAVRAKVSFLELCRTPELACQVTMQPIDRFGFDAAILFSDILVVLPPMGLEVEFGDGGPHLPSPVRSAADVERLAVPDPADSLSYVMEAVRQIRRALAGRVPLIGFAGAPFTLATYAVEGGGSKNYERTKSMMFADPEAFHRVLDRLARTVAAYLEAQVEAGAEAVQLFDSWAGILAPGDFREFALRYVREIVDLLRGSRTWARTGGVPIIYFVNGCAPYLDDLARSGADVLGVDWRVDLGDVRRRLGDRMAVQGNLDPTALFAPEDRLRRRVAEVLGSAGAAPGHIFNLGHGILPPTDPDRVQLVVDTVRELSSAPREGA
jgi:uroporphyrinogen decarboxylase